MAAEGPGPAAPAAVWSEEALLVRPARPAGLHQVPEELSGLAQLKELSLMRNQILNGWQHLPRQLEQFDLRLCHLQYPPAELAGLAQLVDVSLAGNSIHPIQGRWWCLPPHLKHLKEREASLQRVCADAGTWRNRQKAKVPPTAIRILLPVPIFPQLLTLDLILSASFACFSVAAPSGCVPVPLLLALAPDCPRHPLPPF